MVSIKKKITKSRIRRKKKRESKVKGILKTIKKNGTTSIEEKMKKILEDLNLQFLKEAPIKSIKKTKYYDFYVYKENEYEFLIECHGSYWHPMIFNEDGTSYLKDNKKLTKLQKRNIKNDKYKINLAKRHKIPLLIFYENDINKNLEKIKEKIRKEVNASNKRNNEDT